MVDHCIGAKLGHWQVIESEADRDAGNARRFCRTGVIGGVADIGRPAAATALDHQIDRIAARLGAAGAQRIAADYGVEPFGQSQSLEALYCQRFQLVGDNGKLDPARGQIVQHCLAAREQGGVAVDIVAIELEHLRMQRGEFSIPRNAAAALQRLAQHGSAATADHFAHSAGGEGCAPGNGQRVVDGYREVLVGIEQGAVEVKADDIERNCGHRRSQWPPILETARNSWHGA